MSAFIDEPHVLDLMGDREMLTAERCEELMKSAVGREGEITKVRVFATHCPFFAGLISLCSSVPTPCLCTLSQLVLRSPSVALFPMHRLVTNVMGIPSLRPCPRRSPPAPQSVTLNPRASHLAWRP